MEKGEICTAFRLARDKKRQIGIIAELSDTDKETVVEILRDAGLYVKESRCGKCGRRYKRLLAPVCRECEAEQIKRRAKEDARKKWVDYLIAENKMRKAELLRKIAIIDAENQRLKEAIS